MYEGGPESSRNVLISSLICKEDFRKPVKIMFYISVNY